MFVSWNGIPTGAPRYLSNFETLDCTPLQRYRISEQLIVVYDLRKNLVARLGYQTANPGSPDHISGSPENSFQHVLEICRQNILFETLH